MASAAGVPAAAPARPRLRILCLHSFRTSGRIFQEQLQRAGLDRQLADLVELTFIDAPNPASGPIPDDVAPFFSGPYYEWWNANRDAEGRWSYEGWQRSVKAIERALAEQGGLRGFDGLMGFSQGGAITSLAIGMQRSGFALKGLPPLRFCVCFAGIRVRDPQLECFYSALRPCPSLHIIGDKDPVKRLTNLLIDSFDQPVVINHTRGHVIPALAEPDLQRLRAFLQEQQEAVAVARQAEEGGAGAVLATAQAAAAGQPGSRL